TVGTDTPASAAIARMVAPAYPPTTNAELAASRIRRLVRRAPASRRLDRYERVGLSSVKPTHTTVNYEQPIANMAPGGIAAVRPTGEVAPNKLVSRSRQSDETVARDYKTGGSTPARTNSEPVPSRTKDTIGCSFFPARCGSCSATTTSFAASARQPSSTRTCRTGSEAPATSRPGT